MHRTVDTGDDTRGTVSLHEPVLRYAGNPILTPRQVNEVWREPHLQVMTVHNAGAAVLDGRTVMLLRSHPRCGISVLGVARSVGGIHSWTIDHHPALVPAALLR